MMNEPKIKRLLLYAAGVVSILAVLVSTRAAEAGISLVKGQKVYVPVYSHIYHGDREQPFELAITLSIRNTDPVHAISLISVDYYDSEGKLIRKYLENEMKLGAMASARFVVKESDKSGGAGASFIVRWKSETRVAEPIVESIMIGTSTQQGISFSSRGQAIEEERE